MSTGASSAPIESVVFDVGRVLHHFSFEPVLDELRQYATWDLTPRELFTACRGTDYENGIISTDEFLACVQERFAGRLDLSKFQRTWTSIFTPIDEMIGLARSLRTTHRVYLLSNSNAMHWEYLTRVHGLHDCADSYVVSFEAGCSKPDERIYELAESRFNLEPARTLFIDDLEPNTAQARARGWHAITHVDPQTTLREVERVLSI